MRKTMSISALAAFILVFASGLVYSSATDISGSWVGETEVPDQGTDEMTLVIEKSNDNYEATISDSFGMLMDTECENLEYKGNMLSFDIAIYDGYSSLTVYITLQVDEDTMTGYWETEDGGTGEITMARQEE